MRRLLRPGHRWNPAVEQQAQDRIHRLGQYKPIHVTRFIIGGTIEERILKLQVQRSIPVHACNSQRPCFLAPHLTQQGTLQFP